MFKKFFKFVRGYVIIEISGKYYERFINICLRRGIEIWDTQPWDGGVRLCMYNRDFRSIRDAARKCSVTVKICKKLSLKHTLYLYRKRNVLIVCALIAVVFSIAVSQFIWVVEINGVEQADIESIAKTLDELGVKSGTLKKNIPDGMDIKRRIINDTDGIAWAWVYIDGVKARVEIYEQTLPPDIVDKSVPCDIAAACDGVIQRMVVKNGQEQLREGDAVTAGDIIVSGKVPVYKEGNPEEYIFVHSIADIFAYTTHTRTGDYKLYYESRNQTGDRKTAVSLELFGKLVSPFDGEPEFEEYDISENRYELSLPFFGYTGIALYIKCYREVVVNKEPISVDTALEFAKNDMEAKISKEIRAGSTLKDENIEYVQTDNETINVKLTMNFIENIATTQPMSADTDKGEELFDKQTDRNITGN